LTSDIGFDVTSFCENDRIGGGELRDESRMKNVERERDDKFCMDYSLESKSGGEERVVVGGKDGGGEEES
jgi:hypothetical protein